MKRILIYGDSITWGRVPNATGRYFGSDSYVDTLAAELGDEYTVIGEGLRARTLAGENPYFPERNGLEQFGPIFGSQLPIDLLVLFLGSNDVNAHMNKTAEETVAGLDEYMPKIDDWCEQMSMPAPKLLIVAPPKMNEADLKENSMFEGAAEKTEKFAELFSAKASQLGAEFFDASVAKPSSVDGVHLAPEENAKLGKALAEKIKEIL